MPDKTFPQIKVAAVQAEPEFLRLEACIDKCIGLIEQAGKAGCDLIVFPESFIPGYPDWWCFYPEGMEGRQFDKKLFLNSISLESEAMQRLCEACRNAAIYAVLGINETEEGIIGTMHNTHVYINREGDILGKHQKYVPTVGERLTQAPGHTGCYNTFETNFGVVSSLICGENSNPLGIYAAATKYPVVHAASWPSHFGPDLDMHRIIRMASTSEAYMLKAFVISSVTRISEEYIDLMARDEKTREFLTKERERKMGAAIVGPGGEILAVGDGEDSELLLYELNLQDTIIPHVFQDFAGHYQRPEIFAELFEKYYHETENESN